MLSNLRYKKRVARKDLICKSVVLLLDYRGVSFLFGIQCRSEIPSPVLPVRPCS